MKVKLITTLLLTCCASSVYAAEGDVHALVEKYIEEGFQKGDNQDPSRLVQDEAQKVCTQYRNKLPLEKMADFMAKEKATIKYPENGKLMGDWKKGKEAFTNGFAWRIGRIMPDKPDKARGGNCYACHAADPKEVAAGNIGTSLTGYGKLRGNSEATVKYTYEKIYNAEAFMPCSNMPRLGHNGVLSPEQIADIVAFLVDPESPVNK